MECLQKKTAPFTSRNSSSTETKTTNSTGELPFTVLEIDHPIEPLPTEKAEVAPAEISADFSEQDCHFICQSVLQVPAVIWGKHLIRTDNQVQPFSHAFYNYCVRKGINPWDYFFDEFPLVITGIGLVKGMRDDHLKFKEEQKKKKKDGA